ncbi:MAG: extracellular solute-binding protein [Streptococcaceae bacterium]|jgi:arabinogalactan oligomer/maltooligosaccharide transport system substrate-binding protein|nr:extracellular solute-binding protein [Streptococcaceae bacterium]
MKLSKKIVTVGSAVLAAAILTACSSTSKDTGESSSSKSTTVSLWVDTANVDQYKPLVASFEKANPDIKVKMTQSPNGSANAKTDVAKDPSKAADVFKAPNDQLGAMAEAGYINPLSPDATTWVKDNDIELAATAVSWKGKLYAYPQDEQAQVLFYNKTKLTADDVKDWATLTSKGVVGTDFTNAYNWYPAFLSNGTYLFGKDGETLDGTNANTPAGVEVMKWFAAQKANPGVKQSGTALLADFESGKTTAVIDGPWDAVNIKKFLGDNMGVATYPTVDFGSGSKQLQAFTGVGTLAINSKAKNQKAATTLAQYLTNEESQLALFKANGAVPVSKKAQADSTVSADPTTQAVIKQVTYSTVMPKMPEMANFWTDSAPLIDNAYEGKTAPADYQSALDKFVTNISKESK